uniref:Integrase, catalytic region, zinc finger, CCHC-type, peptidase aspartic, catalytic n=1 Tax=Tanacetum cinerariifolium TaxID=118510 RepID=A0A6L2NGJ2_TANCI|nr:hypothetical protein [Tanacetum cinerariifolium]
MLEISVYDSWTRPMKYSEITKSQKLQDDCDVQATNIILLGLPLDVYALVNHQEAVKDIWDRVKLLIKGTKLSYQQPFQTEDLDAYDSDCDDLTSAKAVLMANLSGCDLEVLSKVPYSDSYSNDMINQDV